MQTEPVELDPDLPPNALPLLAGLFEKSADIVAFNLKQSTDPAYLISHPDLIEKVFAGQHRRIKRGFSADRVALLLGDGLLVSEGDVWKSERQLMHPMFHGNALRRPFSVVSHCLDAMLERWERLANTACPLDLNQEMLDLSLEINLRSLFGRDAPALLNSEWLPLFPRLTEEPKGSVRENLQLLKDVRAIRQWIAQRIDERRGEANLPAQDVLADLCVARRRKDSSLLPAGLIVDELISLLTAGHVTLASALSHGCTLLAGQPAEQHAVREEVTGVCGGATIRYEHLGKLQRTRQVIQECLRLCPPIWIMTRRVTAGFELAGEAIADGAHIVVSPYLVHRHPRIWRDPDRFDAARFATDTAPARSRYAYLPFSAGPRSCLGDQLSLMELTVAVATIIRRFAVHIEEQSMAYQPGFVYRGAGALMARLERL